MTTVPSVNNRLVVQGIGCFPACKDERVSKFGVRVILNRVSQRILKVVSLFQGEAVCLVLKKVDTF